MIYKFYNMAGKQIWECPQSFVEHENSCDEGFETHAALQLLFSNFGTPPISAIALVAKEHGTDREEWAVGPFHVIVRKVEVGKDLDDHARIVGMME